MLLLLLLRARLHLLHALHLHLQQLVLSLEGVQLSCHALHLSGTHTSS
jgi:hypothetical protein